MTHSQSAGFAMTLKLLNNKIIFTPPFEDIESAMLETYDTILRGANEIPRFENVLETEDKEKTTYLKPTILVNFKLSHK
jgi:hypothetical protein